MNKNIYNNLYTKDKNNCHKLISKKLKNEEKLFIITANPETFILSRDDTEMNKILNDKNNLIVPDGISIVKTAKYLGINIKERITGVELCEFLLNLANKEKYSMFLFGSTKEVIHAMQEKVKMEYPNINLLGIENGYVDNKDKVMEKIRKLKPDIVLIALGIPNQEKLINKHINDFDKGIFMGVGGSFDVISGSKKRAPKIFIKLSLEWLYRIICEPKRIKRFLKYNFKFFLKMIKLKHLINKKPKNYTK